MQNNLRSTRDLLIARADILNKIRKFFSAKNVLEVETPLLGEATVTDPHVHGIPAVFRKIGVKKGDVYWLQTSPEYAMKRLLSEGSGSIYQICKAFRQGEVGALHNPEFTMLEWYRVGFDHFDLMHEMNELLQLILPIKKSEWFTYAAVFETFLNINPHSASLSELKTCAEKLCHANDSLDSENVSSQQCHASMLLAGIQEIDNQHPVSQVDHLNLDRDGWLDYLFTHIIEPKLAKLDAPIFIYDFPASQAALAKIRNENPPVASRFEVFYKGIELANGFHELTNATEQRKRFEADLKYRKENQMPIVQVDENFLAALEKGLPECAGVALGLDRLIMLALNTNKISDVIHFAF